MKMGLECIICCWQQHVPSSAPSSCFLPFPPECWRIESPLQPSTAGLHWKSVAALLQTYRNWSSLRALNIPAMFLFIFPRRKPGFPNWAQPVCLSDTTWTIAGLAFVAHSQACKAIQFLLRHPVSFRRADLNRGKEEVVVPTSAGPRSQTHNPPLHWDSPTVFWGKFAGDADT